MFEEHGLPMLRILTDRGTEYCGRRKQHEYQLYLAVNDIEHQSEVAANKRHLRMLCRSSHTDQFGKRTLVTIPRKIAF